MRIVFALIFPLVLLIGIAALLIFAPLPQGFPETMSSGRNTLAAIAVGVLGFLYLVGFTGYLIVALYRASRRFEGIFLEKGFEPNGAGLINRRYFGKLAQRSAKIYFAPAFRVYPALLDIRIAADCGFSAAICRGRPLLDCHDCPEIGIASTDTGDIEYYSDNEVRLRSLVESRDFAGALAGFLDYAEIYGLRELYITPTEIWIRARPSGVVSNEVVGQWIEELSIIAGNLEGR